MIRNLTLAVCIVIFSNATQATEKPACTKLLELATQAHTLSENAGKNMRAICNSFGWESKICREHNSKSEKLTHFWLGRVYRLGCSGCVNPKPPKEKCIEAKELYKW